jgi:uncharacterized pyridoxamine 5'-phosphate oxidase family protein
MMIQQALDFLKSHIEVAFATSEGGRPHIRVFQIMKQEGTTLYFATSPEKQVYKQLHENPYIEIMASAGDAFVKSSGRADFHVDDDTARWIYDNNPVLPRLYTSYDKLAYFKMDIEQMDHYDLAPTPPVFKHYDLTNNTEANGYVGERYSTKA